MASAYARSNRVLVSFGDGEGILYATVSLTDGLDDPTDFYDHGAIDLIPAHINSDAFLDLAVLNRDAAVVSVFAGNGDRTFQPALSFPLGATPSAFAHGDLNGDQLPDFVVCNPTSETISVLLGDAATSFTFPTAFAADPPVPATALALGDLLGDAHLDLIVAAPAAGTLVLFNGLGNGTFAEHSRIPLPGVKTVKLADIDQDGRLDLLVSYELDYFALFRNMGGGVFENQSVERLKAIDFTHGDFDNDGDIDIAINRGSVFILENLQNENPARHWTIYR